MPESSVTLELPFSASVVVQAFVNADTPRRFTIAPERGDPIVFTGTGLHDTPAGETMLTTPPAGRSEDGFMVTVTIDRSADGGATWLPSAVGTVPCQIMYLQLQTVASDGGGGTWNDATVYFEWTIIPDTSPNRSRVLARTAQRPEYTGRA